MTFCGTRAGLRGTFRRELQQSQSAIQALGQVPRTPLLGLYSRIEDSIVEAHQAGVRLQKLSEKYEIALAQDDAERTRIKDRMERKVERIMGAGIVTHLRAEGAAPRHLCIYLEFGLGEDWIVPVQFP